MKINPYIFRQYDIRGVVGEDLDENFARRLGQAFGTYTLKNNETSVIVGCDNRISSPSLKKAVTEGLLSTGCNVVDIGTVVTPIFYYARIHFNINPGIMVTASHNPAQFNGFKVAFGPGTIYGDEIQNLRIMMEKGDFLSGQGSLTYKDPSEDYIDMICEKIHLSKKLRVGIDCGNGTASLFAEKLFRRLGVDVYPLYCESDPKFPNHFPDPVKPENLTDLKELVLREKLDLGIGFDGDGDRIGVVDDKGNIIYGDMLMILYWREIMPKYPGAVAIIEVKCSQALVDEVKKLGGKPIFYKTGHSLIKAKMREIGAVFTGEMSGHMFFADEYYGFDDALYAAARLLRILSNTDKKLSELLADVPKYYSTPELRVPCPDEEKFDKVEAVKRYFQDKYPIIDVDGARVIFPDGWGLVRSSNTGPELIVRCEATSKDGLDKIKNEIQKALLPLKLF
ncbi:Phosphomannomutase/phosphoglucomutase [Tepidanaerobacter acetatoxydans Re1]|uniref:Phosphomannomutase/phosphoglucomutase n=1 Tax=Tepidanaerobacter acetatoxydans (strain DSM 21804 / JCM 16047 / Re1) TaxID=1209989 RepID=F4LW67_TEPAE|nr:phosphomannomutase/phosphoglucomutase [Tepidanaerobacter acetatoxydans]AEE90843.1 phosphoglucomutase/phosphomannomutase alpha/beta/alpha domain II [Tepidanaerobacter acetatoxydans Re1]CDI40460.1 Phosphomannomutase/phosphoglucomutase [Tepidanaerobacter acetatoxydans Re1]